MQRCLVQWVSSGKKPSGHPADRGMACWRGACCSLTERGASGGRGPRYRGSRWILAPLLDRKPRAMPCRFVRASDPLSPSARVRSSRMERELRSRKYQRMAHCMFVWVFFDDFQSVVLISFPLSLGPFTGELEFSLFFSLCLYAFRASFFILEKFILFYSLVSIFFRQILYSSAFPTFPRCLFHLSLIELLFPS